MVLLVADPLPRGNLSLGMCKHRAVPQCTLSADVTEAQAEVEVEVSGKISVVAT